MFGLLVPFPQCLWRTRGARQYEHLRCLSSKTHVILKCGIYRCNLTFVHLIYSADPSIGSEEEVEAARQRWLALRARAEVSIHV